ncbi:hypothetical protein M569_05548, partial [Genlisea aurea]
MKRAWRIGFMRRCLNVSIAERAQPSNLIKLIRRYAAEIPPKDDSQPGFVDIASLFSEYKDAAARTEFRNSVSELKDEILGHGEDADRIGQVLEEKGVDLLRRYANGCAVIELLAQLKHFPRSAMEVFSWRRNQSTPMTADEYSKGISLAGKLRYVDLAFELFEEAKNKQLNGVCLYNSLMSTYMYNGLATKCQALFRDLKMDSACAPSIITYNVLISVFGRLVLTDHMEATFSEIANLNLLPTLRTYKVLIAGYVTAWMWDKMEKAYELLKAGDLIPDVSIHLLMLRGYAISGRLEKMEAFFDMVRDEISYKKFPLMRAMICAYSRSCDRRRVEKISELLRLLPGDEYRPWLNVLLIRLYAQEALLEEMEDSIDEALRHRTCVTTVKVMRCIVSCYFRRNAVDRLAEFVRRAEVAGWKSCRSLYHCEMVMYAAEMRLEEMELVVVDMGRMNMPLSKKSLWILYSAYETSGERSKVDKVAGMMWKQGYTTFPLPPCN